MSALTGRLSFTDKDINRFQSYYIFIYNNDLLGLKRNGGKKMKRLTIIILSLFALFIPLSTASAFDIPDKPENNIYDPDGYLSNETKEKLVQFNQKYKEQAEVAVVIAKTIDDNEIADKIAQKWQFSEDKRNAVLVISMNEHNMALKISDKLREVIPKSASIDIYYSANSELQYYRHDTAVQTVINGIEHKLENPPVNTSKSLLTEYQSIIVLIVMAIIILAIQISADISNKKDRLRSRTSDKLEGEHAESLDNL